MKNMLLLLFFFFCNILAIVHIGMIPSLNDQCEGLCYSFLSFSHGGFPRWVHSQNIKPVGVLKLNFLLKS